MRASLRAFAALAAEAFRDGLRRRFAFAIALFLLAAGMGAESCTDLGDASFSINQHSIPPEVLAGFVAPLLVAWQALAVLVITGVVAADHLARPLAEGSAALWLARPVSRDAFAGARLAGALGVGLGAGVLLLGTSASLVVVRQHLPVWPALAAALATALGALAVAGLAMATSLVLGRSAVLLLVVGGVPWIALANAVALVGQLVHPDSEVGGVLGAVDRFGPPLGTAIFAAVAPWNPHVDATGTLGPALARLAVWAIGGTALVALAFRRTEVE
jgi:ABC-type transport system involved in multi-copper enzyme maturation permease subunit